MTSRPEKEKGGLAESYESRLLNNRVKPTKEERRNLNVADATSKSRIESSGEHEAGAAGRGHKGSQRPASVQQDFHTRMANDIIAGFLKRGYDPAKRASIPKAVIAEVVHEATENNWPTRIRASAEKEKGEGATKSEAGVRERP